MAWLAGWLADDGSAAMSCAASVRRNATTATQTNLYGVQGLGPIGWR